jgi:hypothetical protein
MNTLVSALIDIAVRIGKAIVRRLAKWALDRVVGWMWRKIAGFKRGWLAARIEDNKRRMRWLAGRISRWSKAAEWVEKRALKTLREAAQEACKLPAFAKLPEVARCERMVAA